MTELRASVIVSTREDVATWAEELWSQCLNEAARALVGSAAGEYLAMFRAIEAHHHAQQELRAAIEDLALEPDDPVAKALANVAALRAKACPGEVEVRAKLVPLVVQFIAKAQTANRAEADAAMVQLRKFAEERAKLGEQFGPRRKIELVKS